jgi:hypothetical protein
VRVRNGYWIALSSLLVLTAAFLYREMRDTTFWFDEWRWVLDRRSGDLDSLLEPHNGHLSLVPVAIYKALFATAGLTDYAPYRALIIAAHLVCVALVFAYARKRVGDFVGALAAVMILLLGPGWQNIIWPFQIGSVTSLAAGIAALLALDRGDRRGNATACGLLALALASSGLGVVIAIGLLVDLLGGRRPARDLWVVAAPVTLYAVWWLLYQDTDFVRHNIVLAPGFAADAAAGAMGALTGLSGATTSDAGATLPWGRPLAVAAAVLVAWRLARMGLVPARVVTLLAVLLAFWLLTGLQRAVTSSPDSSRYLYAGAVFIILLAAELARGIVVSRRVAAVLAAAAGLAIVANLGDLRDAGRLLRDQANVARADLAAIELARSSLPPGYVAASFPNHPLLMIEAETYLEAARELGSPAASAEELAAGPESARLVTDAELTRLHDVGLEPGNARVQGPTPVVDAMHAGSVSRNGPCITFRPEVAGPAVSTPELQLTLPPAGVRLTAGNGSADITVRRFATGFPQESLSRLAASSTGTLRIARDRSDAPWHVRVASEAAVTACGVAES